MMANELFVGKDVLDVDVACRRCVVLLLALIFNGCVLAAVPNKAYHTSFHFALVYPGSVGLVHAVHLVHPGFYYFEVNIATSISLLRDACNDAGTLSVVFLRGKNVAVRKLREADPGHPELSSQGI